MGEWTEFMMCEGRSEVWKSMRWMRPVMDGARSTKIYRLEGCLTQIVDNRDRIPTGVVECRTRDTKVPTAARAVSRRPGIGTTGKRPRSRRIRIEAQANAPAGGASLLESPRAEQRGVLENQRVSRSRPSSSTVLRRSRLEDWRSLIVYS